jgi:hypothetical protein
LIITSSCTWNQVKKTIAVVPPTDQSAQRCGEYQSQNPANAA